MSFTSSSNLRCSVYMQLFPVVGPAERRSTDTTVSIRFEPEKKSYLAAEYQESLISWRRVRFLKTSFLQLNLVPIKVFDCRRLIVDSRMLGS